MTRFASHRVWDSILSHAQVATCAVRCSVYTHGSDCTTIRKCGAGVCQTNCCHQDRESWRHDGGFVSADGLLTSVPLNGCMDHSKSTCVSDRKTYGMKQRCMLTTGVCILVHQLWCPPSCRTRQLILSRRELFQAQSSFTSEWATHGDY